MNNESLMYSEIVYLFGHETTPTGGILGLNEEHPSGKKLKTPPLTEQMVFASLAFLKDRGYIKIEQREEKKLLILKANNVYLQRLKDPGQELAGIESKLLSNVSKDMKLYFAIINLLSSDYFDPWEAISEYSKKSLVAKGFLAVEEKKKLIFTSHEYKYVEGALNEAEKVKQVVKQSVSALESESYSDSIKRAISSGIKIRQEKPDDDD